MKPEIYLGTTLREDLPFDIKTNPLSILISGITGTGKTTNLNTILKRTFELNPDLELYLADGCHQGHDFSNEVKNITKHPIAGVVQETKHQDLESLLDKILVQLNERKEKYKKIGSLEKSPLLILVIEDFRHFEIDFSHQPLENNNSVVGKLHTILSSGRAFNIIVLLTSQRATVDIVPTILTRNFPIRMIHRPGSIEAKLVDGSKDLKLGQYILRTPEQENLLCLGKMV